MRFSCMGKTSGRNRKYVITALSELRKPYKYRQHQTAVLHLSKLKQLRSEWANKSFRVRPLQPSGLARKRLQTAKTLNGNSNTRALTVAAVGLVVEERRQRKGDFFKAKVVSLAAGVDRRANSPKMLHAAKTFLIMQRGCDRYSHRQRVVWGVLGCFGVFWDVSGVY